jgi:hypothetical protein
MKDLVIVLAVGLSLACCSSCRNNRLKINEKALAKEINSEEKIKKEAERIEIENSNQDTLINIPSGFQYKEDRTVDPAHPPIVIDFSKDIPIREFKLSDIASKVSYLILSVPDDSVFFTYGAQLHYTDNDIIVNNNLGINRFSANGSFVETVCKSWFNAPRTSNFFPRESFRGTWINHVSTADNSVFYKFTDAPEERVSLLRYSMNNNQSLIPIEAKEGQPDTYSKGEVISSGKMIQDKNSAGLASLNIFAVSDNVYAGMPPNLPDAFRKNSTQLITFNFKGDTLCKFEQFDLLTTPVTSSLMRSFSNQKWIYGGIATFKSAFNDTIYRIIPPHRLVPTYVFDLGISKTTVDDWLHINTSLSGKIVIEDILESTLFLFIDYRYYPPDNPKLPNWGKAIFVKNTRELFRIALSKEQQDQLNTPPPPPRPGAPAPPKQGTGTPGLVNDLDGGLLFWPRYITPQGKLVKTISPEILKNYIQSSEYKSKENKGFSDLVRSLKGGGREIVLMITE